MKSILALAALTTPARALDNGVARTPPLGWSSWLTCEEPAPNGTKCGHDVCNEAEVKESALAMAANGMQKLGWKYLVLDDCWAATSRDGDGKLTWDVERFPSGMPALTAWLHSRGFLLGLYTSAGDVTCSSGGRAGSVPGSRNHYDLDTRTFANWSIDYVKLDWCGDVKHEPWVGHQLHIDFANAMNASGRPMLLEVVAGYWFLAHAVSKHANTWRFCEDHHDSWESTEENAACRATLQTDVTRGQPGGWAYMDVLTTGGAGCKASQGAHCPQQTFDECAHATWRTCVCSPHVLECSMLPAPCYLLPATCYLLPATCYTRTPPCSLLPTPCSLLPAPCYARAPLPPLGHASFLPLTHTIGHRFLRLTHHWPRQVPERVRRVVHHPVTSHHCHRRA